MPVPTRRLALLPLLAGGMVSVVAVGAIPHDTTLPLMAVLASLLPLQLAALYWATTAAPRPGSRPPASG
ncbi:hypothetical protein [Cyanobium sp. NIES-981]|uniref:hypothetical protein n=1 Tax=Cyanobium sp. NIES-981 TaxID=1851505 RepID=UPI0007DDAE80|nr:hypothetical protein [Cyanobium sp. NIES-981]SBO44904.1 protein of unknown function [Cyanobium sp. NIES-981]